MYAHISSIQSRLQAALGAPWVVVDGAQAQDRRELPRADIRLSGASVLNSSGPRVTLQARYLLRLVACADGAPALAQLDRAVDAAIGALHHWAPPGAQDRLALQGLSEVDHIDGSLWGYDLGFVLSAVRHGSNE
jgi:hypothetical protein